ncbi:MAG: hypothetical protein JNK42_02450 [Caedimonas sp.]|nr:hypothetical protein [Caedimonas sp.]
MTSDAVTLLKTQVSFLDKILRNYAYRCALIEIWEQHSNNPEEWSKIPEDLKRPYAALENSLYDQICNKLWILFDSSDKRISKEKRNWDIHFHRLLDYPQILSSSEKLKHLAELPGEMQVKELKKLLLALENINEKEFDKAMRDIKIYRKKEISHKELYTIEQSSNPETQRFYPVLLSPIKAAFSLLKTLSATRSSVLEENSCKNYIMSSLLPYEYNFNDYINHHKKNFKLSMDFFLN